jgi:hypothetical protein
MLIALFLALPLHAAPAAPSCEGPRFAFVGQPECVEIAWDGERTQLRSRCEHELLVDLSVLPTSTASPVVQAGEQVALRDLSAFTVGMDGSLYKVVDMVDTTSCDSTPETQQPAATEAEHSWGNGVFGAIVGLWR